MLADLSVLLAAVQTISTTPSSDLSLLTGDPQRPFPQDIEMRCGVLGQLTSDSGKPHPQDLPGTAKGDDDLLPPDKKFALNLLPGRW